MTALPTHTFCSAPRPVPPVRSEACGCIFGIPTRTTLTRLRQDILFNHKQFSYEVHAAAQQSFGHERQGTWGGVFRWTRLAKQRAEGIRQLGMGLQQIDAPGWRGIRGVYSIGRWINASKVGIRGEGSDTWDWAARPPFCGYEQNNHPLGLSRGHKPCPATYASHLHRFGQRNLIRGGTMSPGMHSGTPPMGPTRAYLDAITAAARGRLGSP